jgi:hypothetical protein
MRIPPAALAVVLLLTSPLPAEEAVLPDGRRLPGALALRGGSLQFQPSRGGAPLAMEQIDSVRFDATPPPVRLPLVHQVLLRDGQRLTGEFLGLDERSVRFRPAWGSPCTLPRAAVAAIAQPANLATIFVEDFDDGLRAWTTAGSPECGDREHTSGRRALRLSAGQSAAYALPHALEAGRVGVNVLDRPGARGHVDFVFQTPEESHNLRVTVGEGPGGSARVELPNGVRWGSRAAQPGGWRRLVVDFSAGKLRVLLDDFVLYASLRHGPGGPLRQVRLAYAGEGSGELWFDDFQVARRVEGLPRPDGDPTQDEVWCRSGDQLFGTVPRADRRAIELHARFGKQAYTWADVRGIWLKREPFAARALPGEQVRLGLHATDGFEPDQLDGVVQELAEKRLVLRHTLLGDLAVPREWLGQLKRLPPE